MDGLGNAAEVNHGDNLPGSGVQAVKHGFLLSAIQIDDALLWFLPLFCLSGNSSDRLPLIFEFE